MDLIDVRQLRPWSSMCNGARRNLSIGRRTVADDVVDVAVATTHCPNGYQPAYLIHPASYGSRGFYAGGANPKAFGKVSYAWTWRSRERWSNLETGTKYPPHTHSIASSRVCFTHERRRCVHVGGSVHGASLHSWPHWQSNACCAFVFEVECRI